MQWQVSLRSHNHTLCSCACVALSSHGRRTFAFLSPPVEAEWCRRLVAAPAEFSLPLVVLVAAASAAGACLLRVPVSRNSLNSVSGLATEDLN